MSENNLQALSACTRALGTSSELELTEMPPVYRWLHQPEMIAIDPSHPRAASDSAALLRHHHDAALHRRLTPSGEEAAALFHALEHIRVAAHATQTMPGARQNLARYLEDFVEAQPYGGPTDRPMPLGDAAALYLWEQLTGKTLSGEANQLLQSWRERLKPLLADHLEMLGHSLEDQALYAKVVKSLIDALTMPAKGEESETDAPDPDQQEDLQETGGQEEGDESQEESDQQASPGSEESDGDAGMESGAADRMKQGDHEAAPAEAPHLPPSTHNEPAYAYHVYTAEFDEVINADQLLSAEELSSYRAQLDEKLQAHKAVPTKLANKLRRMLLARQRHEWTYDLDDGMLDSSRLARVVTRPDITDIYKQEKETKHRDTVVSLLIDNSGSMRGRPITIAAMSADILMRTLERCGVKVEVLGFTTKEWKGGQSRKKWLANGQPNNPGRLNDVRHIIYKGADMPLRRGQRVIASMLKENVLKENIDGEALLWAHNRLLKRPEERRILMVISDGAPVDDSTLSFNESTYLDTHLRGVIHMLEKDRAIELLAIGIGHDVTRYYKNAVTLYDVDRLGEVMLEKCVGLFSSDLEKRQMAA